MTIEKICLYFILLLCQFFIVTWDMNWIYVVSYTCAAVLPRFCILQDKTYYFHGICMKHVEDETLNS